MSYTPPFTITTDILNLVAAISEQVGELSASALLASPQLRKQNRIKEGLNRSVFLRRSSHGGIFRGRRCGFCLLSLTLSYLFVALMPFLRPFLHNRRNTAY